MPAAKSQFVSCSLFARNLEINWSKIATLTVGRFELNWFRAALITEPFTVH